MKTHSMVLELLQADRWIARRSETNRLIQRRVVRWKSNNISEEHIDSIFMVEE
jgi:hypothetical protein